MRRPAGSPLIRSPAWFHQLPELIGVDISTPEGLQRAHDSGLFEKRCAIFVRDAVEILEKMD